MDYWCCGVWPSIQISRLWRCGSCSGGMQGLVEGRRLHHQGSREDAQSLKNRLEQTIDNSALRHFPALTLSGSAWAAALVLRQAGQQQWCGWGSAPLQPPPASPRQPRLSRSTLRAGWHATPGLSANTYVSPNQDGWQQLYNLSACRSTGPALHNPPLSLKC